MRESLRMLVWKQRELTACAALERSTRRLDSISSCFIYGTGGAAIARALATNDALTTLKYAQQCGQAWQRRGITEPHILD